MEHTCGCGLLPLPSSTRSGHTGTSPSSWPLFVTPKSKHNIEMPRSKLLCSHIRAQHSPARQTCIMVCVHSALVCVHSTLCCLLSRHSMGLGRKSGICCIMHGARSCCAKSVARPGTGPHSRSACRPFAMQRCLLVVSLLVACVHATDLFTSSATVFKLFKVEKSLAQQVKVSSQTTPMFSFVVVVAPIWSRWARKV